MNRYVVCRELEPAELEALALAMSDLGLPSDAWPDVPHVRQWLIGVAVRRRIRREVLRNRKGTTSAIRYVAATFGLKASRVRGLYYRTFQVADEARGKYSDFPTATVA